MKYSLDPTLQPFSPFYLELVAVQSQELGRAYICGTSHKLQIYRTLLPDGFTAFMAMVVLFVSSLAETLLPYSVLFC